MFDQIESLKQQYTDKYVMVDDHRPELARFRGLAGRIKTINMSGRALVEFDVYNNVGWYDIALDFLKVVDKPPPKPAEEPAKPKAAPAKPAAAKAAPASGEKKLSPLEMARAQGAAKKGGEAPKKSTSDVLAAARAGKAAAPAKEASAPKAPAAPVASAKKMSTADIIAAARAKQGEAASAPAAPPATKQTTAEILAAARRKSVPAEETAPAPPAIEEAATEAPAATFVEPVIEKAGGEKPAKAAPSGSLPKAVPDIIAWCRQHDAK